MKTNLVLLCLLILTAGCKAISEDQAVLTAKSFVDSNVKFYTSEDEAKSIVQKAAITIIDTYKENNEWNIKLHIYSNATGEIKKSGLIVVVDAKTGEIVRDKLQPFKIE